MIDKSMEVVFYTWYPTKLPFPMHSPMKNQQAISATMIALTVASPTVALAHRKVRASFTRPAAPFTTPPISAPDMGGVSSTLAYLPKVARRGWATLRSIPGALATKFIAMSLVEVNQAIL